MNLRWLRAPRVVLASLAVAAVACGGQAAPASRVTIARPKIAYANIGGYLLAYECAGAGSPTVILETGYTASGISTNGPVILSALARRTRVRTYDRAGDGLSASPYAGRSPIITFAISTLPTLVTEPTGGPRRACLITVLARASFEPRHSTARQAGHLVLKPGHKP